jgi:hypothetical protein
MKLAPARDRANVRRGYRAPLRGDYLALVARSGLAGLIEERYAARQYFASGVGDQDVVFEPDPAEVEQRVHAAPVDCVSEFRSFRRISE